MPLVDIFSSDVFSCVSMTAAIQTLPVVPSRIGQLGIFSSEGVPTTSVMIEEEGGLLALLPNVRRGGPGTKHKTGKRTAHSLTVPHIPLEDEVLADSVQNVRAFGTDNQLESVVGTVNKKLAAMKQSHEATWEYHRAAAIQGLVKDAGTGEVIYNLWDEFNVTKATDVDFVFGTTTTDIRGKCLAIKRTIETALGATTYGHIHALCGSTFFDALIKHATVESAYDRYQESIMLRNDPRAGFDFAGIIFENYTGKVGSELFVPATDARFFVVGSPGLFVRYNAPADFVEAVNTVGEELYAKQAPMEWDRGVKLHTQSNPLMICTRPAHLVRGYSST